MQTKNYGYLSRLDHLRFIASALVIFLHFRGDISKAPADPSTITGFIYRWINSGATGVSLFLVLSGFIFCVICNAGKKHIEYKQFITNRVLRIFPLVIFVFSIAVTIHGPVVGIGDILRLLLLQFNTGFSASEWMGKEPILVPMWTLAVEFQFYLLFPFIALFIGRYGMKYAFNMLAMMIIIKFIIINSYGDATYHELYKSLVGRLDQFIIGVITGCIYISNKDKRQKTATSVIMFIISLTAISWYTVSHKSAFVIFNFSLTIEAMLWAFMAYSYIMLPVNIPSALDKLLSYLGALSFSMYLMHIPVGRFIQKTIGYLFTGINPAVVTALVILPAIVLVSIMTFTLIEKPFINLRRGYVDNK
ncbi:acyltransferase [Enterobacter cloacae]|uniref:acyltransferase family protein n=1 Tax=Enterobacter cloacae TaxID=550 RepID=UPI001596D700|nr:acyltransferase [Enterobacter cloacae]MCK7338408.1 acyltransferase [Enterobacter cloacae]MDX7021839.1 acyltransferase [Enterobacter cloacae]